MGDIYQCTGSGQYCAPTSTCTGLCYPLNTGFPTSVPPTTITPPVTPTVTPTPTPTKRVCEGKVKPCPWGQKCVNPNGKNCGLDPYCFGHCVPF